MSNKLFPAFLLLLIVFVSSCRIPQLLTPEEHIPIPASFAGTTDSNGSARFSWRLFFSDPDLQHLIDTALKNNQELQITLQEIEIARNDIRLRKAALLPTITYRGATGIEKVGRYTSQGAGDASADITPGKKVPEYLGDMLLGFQAGWEADIWKKLHQARDAAKARYLATEQGRNFVLTQLIAEVASSYYELLTLDSQLAIVEQNIALQQNALELVKIQKEAARSSELAVQKFQAEVLKTQSMKFELKQHITETENRINLLLGRNPQPILRHEGHLTDDSMAVPAAGSPSQLFANRPDILQAEQQLAAARLDVKVARAEFYPSLGLSSVLGLQAFNPAYLIKAPESILFSVAADLAGPLVNRNAIVAEYRNANARQVQAMYHYAQVVVNAFNEVANRLAAAGNLKQQYELQSEQVQSLSRSIDISNEMFKAARADYLEVAKLELSETRKEQWVNTVELYRSLGGGWQ